MAIFWRKVNPALLEPQFREDIERLLGDSDWDWYVLYGFRSGAEQQVLYEKHLAGGPKAAPPGKSPHEFGLAVDVVCDMDPEKAGLQPQWQTNWVAWQWLFEAIRKHPRLHSGKSFNDADHIERYLWHDHKGWKEW